MPSRVTAKVRLLDGETQEYAVQLKSHASNLITDVMKYLNVLEADYFGIQYSDKEDNLVFLDPSKRIDEQLKNTDNSLQFKFVVRFYPNSPCDLEEFTRYLIALQLKEDILNNQYKCTERNILVFMLAAIVQSIYGDYEQTECSRSDYIADMNILPTNIEDKKQILNEVRKKHMCFKEMTASESDSKLLDVACKLESYGLRFQPCKDKSGADVKLSVSYAGVVIYQGDTKKEFYTWPRIRKLAFKKNKLQLKLKHEQHPMKKGDVMEYAMSSRDTCKNIWRNCIEHYAFFRLDVQPKPKPKPIVFKRGSTFRYSGKTHKQLNDLVKHSNFKRQKFERYSVRRQRAATADESGGAGDAKRLSDANSSTRGTNELDEGSFTLNEEQQNAQQQPTAAAETTTELSKIDEEKSNKQEGNKTNDQAVPESKEQNGEEEDKTEAAAAQEEEEATTKKQNEEDWQVESGDLHSNTQKQQDAGGGTNIKQQNNCDVTDNVNNDDDDDVITSHSHTNNNNNDVDDDDVTMTSQVVVVDDSELIPPPLPPKSRVTASPTSPVRHHHHHHHDDEPMYANTMTSASGGVMLRHKHSFRAAPQTTAHQHHRDSVTSLRERERCTSFTPSELGISLMGEFGGGEVPRTPSQYEMLESKMIAVGLYAAPKKPPIPPPGADVISATSSTSNGDVTMSSSRSSDDEDGGHNGTLKHSDNLTCEDGTPRGIEPSMLEPIVMKFDDDISSTSSVTSQHDDDDDDVLVVGDRGSFALDMSMNMTSSMERIIRQHHHDGDDVINL